MAERLFWQGRVFAQDKPEAEQLATSRMVEKGYRVLKVKVWPSPIQPFKGVTWWDFLIELEDTE